MCCGRLLEVSLDFDAVWVNLGASIGGGVDVILGGTASLLVKGGDLAVSEASGLTRSRSSFNSLVADLVRLYDGLIFDEKKKKPGSNDSNIATLAKERTYHVHHHRLDP